MSEPKNWRTYERHPISARYPDIKGQAWEDFVDNLTKRKIKGRSITLYEGKVLDGWQLQRACLEKNIEPNYVVLRDGEDPEEFVVQANELRRHEGPEAMCLRREQRLERVAAKRRQGKSQREIAEEENVSQSTIRRDLEASTAPGGAVEPPNAKIRGRDGRLRPSRGRTKKTKKDGPKSGDILFQFKDIHGPLGQLVRLIDKFGSAYHCKETPAAEGLRRLLEQFRSDFKRWAEFKMKRVIQE